MHLHFSEQFNLNTEAMIAPLVFGTRKSVASLRKENASLCCSNALVSADRIECWVLQGETTPEIAVG